MAWDRVTQTKCKDCGGPLDSTGICYAADSKDASRMTAPVYCGNSVEAKFLGMSFVDGEEMATYRNVKI